MYPLPSANTRTDWTDHNLSGEIVTFTNLKQTTSIGTKQRFTPQVTATISGPGSGTLNGQVDFEIYKGAVCSGTLVYFETNGALPASGTVKTTYGDPATLYKDAEARSALRASALVGVPDLS